MGKTWTPQEEQFIREKYPTIGAEGIVRYMPYRSVGAIQQRASALGLKRNKKEVESKDFKKVEVKEPVKTITKKEAYQNYVRLSALFYDNNVKNINNLNEWAKTLKQLLDLIRVGDRITFNNGKFVKKENGFYCESGASTYIGRTEFYPGNSYSLSTLVETMLEMNTTLVNWNRDAYWCGLDVNTEIKLREEAEAEERTKPKHKGAIQGSPEEREAEAVYRIQAQIDGYIEKSVRGDNFTEVYTVEGGCNHIRYRVYDAGDIYIK